MQGKSLLHDVVVALLEAQSFGCANEAELQAALADLMAVHNVEREYRLNEKDRIDFLVKHREGNVGVEVKVGGSLTNVLRQLARYADCDAITSLVLVTTRSKHKAVPPTLRGKPLSVVYVGGVA